MGAHRARYDSVIKQQKIGTAAMAFCSKQGKEIGFHSKHKRKWEFYSQEARWGTVVYKNYSKEILKEDSSLVELAGFLLKSGQSDQT